MFPGCALDSGVSLRAEGSKVRVELAACSPGVLMPLADPCARRELDRKACLIHESPAEVLWGFWLHCPFSVKRELEENRTTPEPRIARRISLMWESGRACASLPRGEGIVCTSNFAVVVKDGKFNLVQCFSAEILQRNVCGFVSHWVSPRF